MENHTYIDMELQDMMKMVKQMKVLLGMLELNSKITGEHTVEQYTKQMQNGKQLKKTKN